MLFIRKYPLLLQLSAALSIIIGYWSSNTCSCS